MTPTVSRSAISISRMSRSAKHQPSACRKKKPGNWRQILPGCPNFCGNKKAPPAVKPAGPSHREEQPKEGFGQRPLAAETLFQALLNSVDAALQTKKLLILPRSND